MAQQNFFNLGFREMLPITTGIIPFGAVVGALCSETGFSFLQTMSMNVIVYAGASQIVATELMGKHAASAVVIATGLIINIRFLLYSAAMSPFVQNSSFLVKLTSAHLLTDQSYAVMSVHQDRLKTSSDAIRFYFGGSVCMMLIWHSSVMAGHIFGNFAPTSWAPDYAVPLSFVSLVTPALKNKKYILVAIFSCVVSVFLNDLPYRMGLILTAVLSILLAALITHPKISSSKVSK